MSCELICIIMRGLWLLRLRLFKAIVDKINGHDRHCSDYLLIVVVRCWRWLGVSVPWVAGWCWCIGPSVITLVSGCDEFLALRAFSEAGCVVSIAMYAF